MEGANSDEAVWNVESEVVDAESGCASIAVLICKCAGETGREMVGTELCTESRLGFLGIAVNHGWVRICAMVSRFVGSTCRMPESKFRASDDGNWDEFIHLGRSLSWVRTVRQPLRIVIYAFDNLFAHDALVVVIEG